MLLAAKAASPSRAGGSWERGWVERRWLVVGDQEFEFWLAGFVGDGIAENDAVSFIPEGYGVEKSFGIWVGELEVPVAAGVEGCDRCGTGRRDLRTFKENFLSGEMLNFQTVTLFGIRLTSSARLPPIQRVAFPVFYCALRSKPAAVRCSRIEFPNVARMFAIGATLPLSSTRPCFSRCLRPIAKHASEPFAANRMAFRAEVMFSSPPRSAIQPA